MKNLFRAKIITAVCLLATACGQGSPAMSPSVLPITIATTPPPTSTPALSEIATLKPTPRPTYVQPTLIPTIDPALLPELLGNAFSIQTLDLNGYTTRRITGWDYGFGTVAWYVYCPSHVWLDTNYILLYPIVGQTTNPIEGEMRAVEVVPQPVVISVDSGNVWLLPVNLSSGSICNRVYWSPELEILVIPGTYEGEPAIFTYSFSGTKLATYPGKLLDISPKGTKILLTDYKVIDFITNKKIELNWNLVPYEYYWDFYWTSDETRIYRCCYFYADLVSEKNFQFAESDFLDSQGNPFEYSGLSMYRGEWVRDDTFFLVWWSYLDDGDMRYLPMFDPVERTLYDIRKMAGISPDLTCPETDVSPDGQYVWIMCYGVNYLVNLYDFKTTIYQGYTQVDMYWSHDSQFARLENYNASENKVEILSIADKELKALPIAQLPESRFVWHPNHNVMIYPSNNKNALIFLDAETMSFRELSFKDQDSQYKITNLTWNPNGEKFAFVTENSNLWLVDYPSLENLEQIISSVDGIKSVEWSPDGNSISFISGSDIYIVDTIK